PEVLKERKIIKKQLSGIKVLANGELTKKLTIKAQRFSAKAVTKIENAGGKAEVI
ncbi:MAG: uL15 family ribosomal protein, partial [Bacilli bacterium]|nr:uL15 family ribosomal protein [Bacilli bacterium]